MTKAMKIAGAREEELMDRVKLLESQIAQMSQQNGAAIPKA